MTDTEKRFAMRRIEVALDDAVAFGEGVGTGVLVTQDFGPMWLSPDGTYQSSQITITVTDAVPPGRIEWKARIPATPSPSEKE